MKNILVDVPVDLQALERLQSTAGINAKVADHREPLNSIPTETLRHTHILFCSTLPPNFGEMTSLEFIQIAAVGCEQLYELKLVERGIRVCNSRGVFDVPIAEWNIAMMVNLARNLRDMIRNQQAGIWDRQAEFQREIRGSTVGIWGYGGIGRETARLAKALGMTVHVMSRKGIEPRLNVYSVPCTGDPEGLSPDRVFTDGQRMDFLANLDFLVLAIPKIKSTVGIIGERELQALPRTAFVLNPARGPLIREEALLRALQEGWIAGAALDAHYYYPMPADHPLWCFPNVIMTPHISGSTLSPRYKERIWHIFVQNVEWYISGQPLINELSQAEIRGE